MMKGFIHFCFYVIMKLFIYFEILWHTLLTNQLSCIFDEIAHMLFLYISGSGSDKLSTQILNTLIVNCTRIVIERIVRFYTDTSVFLVCSSCFR